MYSALKRAASRSTSSRAAGSRWSVNRSGRDHAADLVRHDEERIDFSSCVRRARTCASSRRPGRALGTVATEGLRRTRVDSSRSNRRHRSPHSRSAAEESLRPRRARSAGDTRPSAPAVACASAPRQQEPLSSLPAPLRGRRRSSSTGGEVAAVIEAAGKSWRLVRLLGS